MMYSGCTHGVLVVCSWCTHGVLTVYSRCVHGVSVVYSRCTHGVLTIYSLCVHGVSAVLTVYSRRTRDVFMAVFMLSLLAHSWYINDVLAVTRGVLVSVPTVFSWRTRGALIAYSWYTRCVLMLC